MPLEVFLLLVRLETVHEPPEAIRRQELLFRRIQVLIDDDFVLDDLGDFVCPYATGWMVRGPILGDGRPVEDLCEIRTL